MIIILSLTLEKKRSEHHIHTIIVDAELGHLSRVYQTTERVWYTLDKCRDQICLTDTFTVDHLLFKLSSSAIEVLASMSRIDGIGLSLFKSILKNCRSKIRIFYVFLSATICISKAMLMMFVIKQ